MTRGLYIWIAPVAGSKIAASTNDPWFAKSIYLGVSVSSLEAAYLRTVKKARIELRW